MRRIDGVLAPSLVLAPHPAASHPDHVHVAEAARRVFGDRVLSYHTYDAAGKVRRGTLVPIEPVWIGQKLRALARYESQITHPRAHQFFMDDLQEYVE
jgi:LmbE family N-acetylglucosaminyl deacetylase